MAIFDSYISRVLDFIEESESKSRNVRKFYVSSNQSDVNKLAPKKNTAKTGANIVLKSDTFLELGSPSAGSCAMTLLTNDTTLLKDGMVALIGPDVKEAISKELPFGQVAMVAGQNLNEKQYPRLTRYTDVSHYFEGYMIKSTTENLWSRISHKAADNGFDFMMLGAAIIQNIKTRMPAVQAVAILFVTSCREDVLRLKEIGSDVQKIGREIKGKIWKERGVNIFECGRVGHCGDCEDKKV